MDKLLKLEKYQLLHNSIYWCGMIGIFILGFFTADTYVTEVMGSTEEIASSLADIFNGMVYDSTFLLIIMSAILAHISKAPALGAICATTAYYIYRLSHF